MARRPETSEQTVLQRRIRERLDATGKSPHAVSREIGANPGYVRDLLDPAKTGSPSAEKMMQLANALDTTAEFLLGTADSPDQVHSAVTVADRRIEWRGPSPEEEGIPIVGTGDCADLDVETLDGDRIEVERSSFDPDYHVRYILRPPAFRGATDLFAIYFHGDSMEPRYYPGEVGIVDPRRSPRPGDDVLIQLRGEGTDDVVSVLVKQLVRRVGDHYELRQFNPALTFRLPKRQVKHISPIFRSTDLLL